eukprot:comp17849_c0_seq1/m.18016 comp17849_c0_seq1/g.18016  ORF comp17849_c0_seq1/g.18016 comp17849_c0_seq1/m.18016 type:complete len:507 (-) comp17849_c0_seq1:972-2492(-)
MASVGTYLDVVRLLEFKTHNSQQVVRVVLRDKPNESTWIFLSQIDKAKLPELVAALAANENAPSPTASQSIPSTPPATPQADQSANDTTAVIKPEPISFEAPPTPVSPDVKPPTLPQSPDIKPSVEPQISTNDTSTPLASRRRARIQPIKSEPFGTPPSLLALNHVHFFGDDDCMVVDPPPRPPPDIIEIVDDEPEIPTFSQTPLKVKTEISASVDGAEVAASPCECQPLAEVKNEPNTTKATNTTNATNTMDTTNTTNTTNTTSTTNTNSANTDGPINPTRLWSNTPISTNLPMDQSPASRIFRVPVPTPTQPIERSSESQSPSSVQSSHQSETTSAREGSAYDSNSSDDYYTPVSKRKDRDEDTSEPSAAKRPKENTNADMIAERKKRDPTKRYQMSKKEAFKYLYRAGKDDPAAVKEEDEDPTTRAFFMTLRERPVVHCTKRPSGPGAENTYIIKKRYSSKYGTSCHWCRQKTVDKKSKVRKHKMPASVLWCVHVQQASTRHF